MFRNRLATRRSTGRGAFAPRVNHFYIEPLEQRRLLNAVSWIGSASGDWNNPSNWSGAMVPGAGDDVTISAAAGVTVAISDGESAASLTMTTPVSVLVTGSLAVGNGLTVNGTILSVAGAIDFLSTQTLGGTAGKVSLNGGSLRPDSSDAPMTLTIGAGITVDGTGVIEPLVGTELMVNNGTIEADVSGGTLSIDSLQSGSTPSFTNNGTLDATNGTLEVTGSWTSAGSITASAGTVNLGDQAFGNTSTNVWTNTGSITVNNSTVNLGGALSPAGLGSFSRAGGTVNVLGVLNLSGSPLALNSSTGPWILTSGVIENGTVTGDATNLLDMQGGTITGITFGAGPCAEATGDTVVNGNLVLSGTVLTLAPSLTFGELDFPGTQTISGTGTVVLTGSGISGGDIRPAFESAGESFTIGNGITIKGGGVIETTSILANTSIVNDGVIDATGGILNIIFDGFSPPSPKNDVFANNGTLEATQGGDFISENVQNAAGATLSVDGTSTLELDESWTNAGTFTAAAGATVIFGDTFGSAPSLGSFTPGGASVDFSGAGTATAPQVIYASSLDSGVTLVPLGGSGGYGTVDIDTNLTEQILYSGSNTYVQVQPPPGAAGTNAVYAKSLTVGAGCTLDLNHLNFYAQTVIDEGSIINGTVTQLPATPVAAQLAFANQPTSAPIGATLAPFTVDVEDSAGNLIPTDTSSVTISIVSNPGNVVLGGTTTIAAVNGVATFSDISIPIAGNYSLTATDGSTTPATSDSFLIFSLSSHIGGLDPHFGVDGVASHDVGFASTNGQAIQVDGKTVIIGTAGTSPNETFGITRYNADGSLDTTFGTAGVVDTSFGSTDDAPSAVAVLGNGLILVAGTASTFAGGVVSGSQFALAEYNTDGSPVSSFGGGQVLFGFSSGALSNDVVHDMVISSTGIIYLGGSSDAAGTGKDFAVAAFNPDGSLDTAFAGGHATLNFSGGDDVINALALQRNGDVVAAGSTSSAGVTSVALARFLPTGVVDPHFGSGGKVVTTVGNLDDEASAVAIQTNGAIVIAGFSASGSAAAGTLTSNFLVARYTAAGKIDPSFGRGPVVTSFNQPAAATGVLIDSLGNVLVSGRTTASLATLVPDELDAALARYTTKGTLDPTFNGTGTSIIPLSDAVHTEVVISTETATILPLIATTNLQASLTELEAKAQSVEALPGGEISIVTTIGLNTDQAVAITQGVDLAASLTSSVPTAVVGGSKGTTSVNIIESGDDPAVGSITIDLVVSPNANGTGGSSAGAFAEKINFKEGRGKIYKLNFVYPAGLANGNYFVIATVNSGALRDLNASNNVAASTTPVDIAAPFVALSGSNLTLAPFKVGKPTQASFDLIDNGNIPAKGTITFEFLASADQTVVDGTVLETTPILNLNLKNGASKVIHEKLIIPTTLPTGTYFLLDVLQPSATLNDPNASTIPLVSVTTFTV